MQHAFIIFFSHYFVILWGLKFFFLISFNSSFIVFDEKSPFTPKLLENSLLQESDREREREREKTKLVNGILNASVNIMLWFNHKSFGNATNFGTSHDCPKYIIESINLNHVHWAHFSACHCLLKVSSERGVPTNKTMSNDN